VCISRCAYAGFRAGAAYQSWAAPLDGWQVLTSAGAWSYQSMKVRPQQLNSIFVPQAFTQMTNYMTSAASSTANTSALTSVPNVSLSIFNQFLQTANAGDQTNTRDDAGLPILMILINHTDNVIGNVCS
jgi:hypothetical protein